MHFTREEKHGLSSNSVTEHSPLPSLLREGKGENALMKDRKI